MLTTLALAIVQVPAPCTPDWTPFGAVPSGPSHAAVQFDDGSGRALYVGGDFTSVGGLPAQHIARWDGHAWSSVGDGFDARVFALCVHDDGSGPALYAGGEFRHSGSRSVSSLARWDGTVWQEIGGGLVDMVAALASFDDGTGQSLFVGGNLPASGFPAPSPGTVLRWDGTTFHDLPGPLNAVIAGRGFVWDLEVFDDGSGEKLWVGGSFDSIGTQQTSHLATWDGQSWAVPGGFDAGGVVNDLEVFDGPAGRTLVATGRFSHITGNLVRNVVAWDGQTWTPLGLGIGDPFFAAGYALATYDDGQGEDLYLAGSFNLAGTASVKSIARWDGTAWSAVGAAQPTNNLLSLAAYDDAVFGPMLFAGGFGQIPATGEPFAWRWGGCGIGAIGAAECSAIPNSTGSPGRIEAFGAVRRARNDVVLRAENLDPQVLAIFIASQDAGFVAQPGGSMGNLCLSGSIGRYSGPGQAQVTSQAGAMDLRIDLDQIPGPTGARSALAGETWRFQAWHRAILTATPTSNFSDAVAITFE